MEQKTERITIRVTPEMKDKLQKAASAVGLSLSAYLLYRGGYSIGDEIGQKIVDAIKSKE